MEPQPTSQAYLDTAHLLRRAAFGGTPAQIQQASEHGIAATVQGLVNYEATPDAINDDAVIEKLKTALPEAARALTQLRLPTRLVQVWWLYRMLATPRPLQEKMVLFWHNHFTSKDGDGQGLPMLVQNQLFRRNALGNFRTLALAVSKDPEMLRYLNGNQNYKAHPNENYARELMELFTCGRVGPDGKPNYTEDDIKASARAFSGWNLRAQQFYYNPGQHDDTPKTFMGRTGNFNGDDIVDILVALPATAYYVCHKLFRYFAYDDPEPAVMKTLTDTYYNSGYEIRPIVEQILTSNAFFSAKARGAVIKSPADYVVGSIRMLGLAPAFAPDPQYLFGEDPNGQPTSLPDSRPFRAYAGKRGGLGSPVGRLVFLANQIRNMGQDLLGPPTVKGWDGGEMWINTDTLQARARFAMALSMLPDLEIEGLSELAGAPTARPVGFGQGSGIDRGAAERMLNAILTQLGPIRIAASSRQSILDYAVQEPGAQLALRGMLSLVMGTPEYQVA